MDRKTVMNLSSAEELSVKLWAACLAGQTPGSHKGVRETLPAPGTANPSPLVTDTTMTLRDGGLRNSAPGEVGYRHSDSFNVEKGQRCSFSRFKR